MNREKWTHFPWHVSLFHVTQRENTQNNMLNNWSVTKNDRYFSHTWSQYFKLNFQSLHKLTWLDDIHFNIRWQIHSSVSFLWFFRSIDISLWYFKTILRHSSQTLNIDNTVWFSQNVRSENISIQLEAPSSNVGGGVRKTGANRFVYLTLYQFDETNYNEIFFISISKQKHIAISTPIT